MKRMGQVRIKAALLTACMALIGACGAMPEIATDVSYCCEAGTESIASFRVEFEDTPEFLKPMLRDEAAIVLGAKGLDYTEGDAHSILLMTFINRTLNAEERRDLDSWEKVAPGGGVRFIAEVKIELKNSVTGELLWSGSMRRVHNVYEGSYMHDLPARAAMRQAFMTIFADYPNPRVDNP